MNRQNIEIFLESQRIAYLNSYLSLVQQERQGFTRMRVSTMEIIGAICMPFTMLIGDGVLFRIFAIIWPIMCILGYHAFKREKAFMWGVIAPLQVCLLTQALTGIVLCDNNPEVINSGYGKMTLIITLLSALAIAIATVSSIRKLIQEEPDKSVPFLTLRENQILRGIGIAIPIGLLLWNGANRYGIICSMIEILCFYIIIDILVRWLMIRYYLKHVGNYKNRLNVYRVHAPRPIHRNRSKDK